MAPDIDFLANELLSVNSRLKPARSRLAHTLRTKDGSNSSLNSDAPRPVVDLFDRQALVSPNATAVEVHHGHSATYADLKYLSQCIASALSPVKSGDIVPICMDVSVEFVAAIIAVLRLGAAYVILDPQTPVKRNQYIAEDTGASVVLVHNKYQDHFTNSLSIDSILADIEQNVLHPYSLPSTQTTDLDKPAYLVYTSGSTGKPKGVLLSHRAVSHGIQEFSLNGKDRWLLFYNPVFSAAQRSILATLCKGACLCLAERDMMATALLETVTEMRIDALGITPSALSMLNAQDCPTCLEQVTVVGEPLAQSVADSWSSRTTLRISYGLSECAQLNLSRKFHPGQNPRMVGMPSDTTSAFVLDHETLLPVKQGEIGELCLSGPQLSLGYLGLSSLTEEKFPTLAGRRIFRTGDAARSTKDGGIEITGRLDFMIKLNGQRIEPGEISSVLNGHALVKSAAVCMAVIKDTPALLAAVVPHDTVDLSWSEITNQLRTHVQGLLPRYMIPSYWKQYDKMPTNLNAKIDIATIRRNAEDADPASFTDLSTSETFVPVADGLQILLRDAWATVLEISSAKIGLHDSFIGLGGTSMQAIRVVQILRDDGIEVDLADILQTAELALVTIRGYDKSPLEQFRRFELVSNDEDKTNMVSQRNIVDAYPATPLQEGILASTLQGNKDYLYQRLFDIRHLDMHRLKLAVYATFLGNETLRATFVSGSSGLYQVIRSDFALPWVETTGSVDAFCLNDKEAGFDLGHTFVRFTVLNRQILVVSMHHSLFDFWSHRFFFEDVAQMYLYGKMVNRPHWSLYVDYISKLNISSMESFWQSYLSEVKPTIINHAPTDKSSMVSREFSLNLKDIRRLSGLTTGTLVYAAWALVLTQHTGADEATFATAIAGREIPVSGVDKIDGPTLTMVPQRIKIEQGLTFKQVAETTRHSMTQMLKHSQYGMRRAIKAGCNQGASAILDTMVNILPKVESKANQDVDYVFQRYGPRPAWKTEFTTLEVEEDAGCLNLRLSSTMEKTRLDFMLVQVCNAMQALVTQPETVARNFTLFGAEEEAFLISHPPLDVPSFQFLHQGFEEVAAAHPDRTALCWQDGSEYTYSQLNAICNQLAWYLKSKSVVRGQKVPLVFDKGPRMVLAMIAVLKCGAAYVPLSSENPLERNLGIIQEVKAPLVLTEDAQTEYLAAAVTSQANVEFLLLDDVDLYGAPVTDHKTERGPEDPAYLIYTSGSTGTPKGVVVPHRAVAATIHSLIKLEGRNNGDWRTLQFSQYVFDVSVYDIFVTLSSGGTLCLAETEKILSNLAGTMEDLRVNHAFLTPSVARLIKPEDVPSLRTLVVGGEQVTKEIVNTWADKVRLINGYGPTEAAVLVATREIAPSSQANNIGLALPTAHAVIVDPTAGSDRLVPYGAVGELCFSGPQLAHGYFNREEQTAAAWQDSAVVATTGGVMYRSGDLARFLPGREIECLGRKDGQVKVNGLRIELGEIEQRIMKEEDVVDCVAMVTDWNGKPALMAYLALLTQDSTVATLVSASEEWCAQAQAIKHRLMMHLTPYMIPKAMFPLTAMPRSLSGKTDKKRLLAMTASLSMSELSSYALDGSAASKADFLPLETQAQELLHKAWQEVLRTGDLDFGRNASFLDVGGDSIEAINLASNLRAKGVTLSVAQILKSANLEIMASHLDLDAIVKSEEFEVTLYETPAVIHDAIAMANIFEDVEYIYPCPAGQSEFLTQGARADQHWDLLAVRKMPSGTDVHVWKDLTCQLTQTNDILRTTFMKHEEQWYGAVLKSPDLLVSTHVVHDEADRKQAIESLWRSRFVFGKPFIQYLMLEHSDGSIEIAIKMDHGLYDGTLLRIFAAHFGAYQNAMAIPRFTSFKDYAMHEYGSNKKQSLKFWTEPQRIPTADFSFPKLPTTAPQPHTDVSISANAVVVSDITTLEQRSRALGSTVSIIYQAAFQLWLARAASNFQEVQLDYLYTGRNVALPDPQSINGPCANFLPLRFGLDLQVSVQTYLDDVAAEFWAATENGNVGLDDIYRAANGSRDALRNGALYLFQPFNPPAAKPAGSKETQSWVVMAKSQVTQPQPYGLVFEVSKTVTTAHRIKIGYDGRIFNQDEAKRVGEEVHVLVERLIQDGNANVESILDL